MVALTSRFTVLAAFISLAAVSLEVSSVGAAVITREPVTGKASTMSLPPRKEHHKSSSKKSKSKSSGKSSGKSGKASAKSFSSKKESKKSKSSKKGKHHHESRFADADPLNPVAQVGRGAQAFFQVISRAAGSRLFARHHHHHHHHHHGSHRHSHSRREAQPEPDHEHNHHHHHHHHHDHRSVKVSDENGGSYTVSERGVQAEEVSEAEGRIDVMTPDQKKVGSLWYDSEKNAMFVSDANATAFAIDCPFSSSDPQAMLCRFKTHMYANASEVSRCVAFDGTSGSMDFEECSPTGDHQTFLYDESTGIVRPTVNSANSTTPAGEGDADEEQVSDLEEGVSSFSLGARDGGENEGTNVTLVFVPRDPSAPAAKMVAENTMSAEPSTVYMTQTTTVTVTGTDIAAAAVTFSPSSSSTMDSSSVPTITSSSSAAPSSTINQLDVEVHSPSASSDAAIATESSSASAPMSTSSDAPVDPENVASKIAEDGEPSDETSSTDSSQTLAARSPDVTPASTEPYMWKFRADKA